MLELPQNLGDPVKLQVVINDQRYDISVSVENKHPYIFALDHSEFYIIMTENNLPVCKLLFDCVANNKLIDVIIYYDKYILEFCNSRIISCENKYSANDLFYLKLYIKNNLDNVDILEKINYTENQESEYVSSRILNRANDKLFNK